MFGGGREEGVAVSQDRSVSLRAAPRNPWSAETMDRSMAVKFVWVTSRVQVQVSISGENLGTRAKHKHCTEITWYIAFPLPSATLLKSTWSSGGHTPVTQHSEVQAGSLGRWLSP